MTSGELNGSVRGTPRSWLQELSVCDRPEGKWEARGHYLTINFHQAQRQGAPPRGAGPEAENMSTERSICPKQQLLLRDGMSLREQGVLSPTHPFFLPLLFLHSRRKPPRTPESWPETLSLLTQCPRVNLSITRALLSCPLPCSLPGLQETRPQPDLLLNQPLPHSCPSKNRKRTANAQTLAIHRLALRRAAGAARARADRETQALLHDDRLEMALTVHRAHG